MRMLSLSVSLMSNLIALGRDFAPGKFYARFLLHRLVRAVPKKKKEKTKIMPFVAVHKSDGDFRLQPQRAILLKVEK
ncbi:hypothetical protein FB567DRAFT_535729 [Paraphoma chrysanthemicola]|uniref:Secreted protein n=1 Tax=Paraphoma chrysanthemicola TaxID=798071 RepID=A0A8K0QZC3_9PLEO|nr:hypothetical protein FB567DRAFT_535729 [Paraphoma chrysanthemicola]